MTSHLSPRARTVAAFLAVSVLVVLSSDPAFGGATPDAPRRVYGQSFDPRENPDYGRHAVRPPTWETFGNRTRFTCLRGFDVRDDQIVGYSEELEKFTRTFQLGEVIWPAYPVLFAKNLEALADELKRRDLFLFDVWGYVPGSGPGGYWQQFTPPAGAFALLESKLGERWLGTDIGEQDGRYVGGYADQMTPASADRFEQYLNFHRHFARMSDDLGHRHAALVSLNYGHYLLKEGTFTFIGAETAQALPNNQVYYAFIRGAGKQYGVPWFGNASIYNRWGYKTYGAAGGSGGDTHGPTKGTSLSLLKRLLYSHVLYNCMVVGFENGWFDNAKLSPIGRIQQSAQRWVREHGQPGVMLTPVALLLDFNAGWTFPRHLYSDKVYRVWGNLPYGPGDYLTDAVLDLLYPGYANSSYFHEESGFIAPTPYGDVADCLLSDAPAWLLRRYAVIVVAGELAGGREVRDKLQAYVEDGGHLFLTAANLAKLPGGIAGCTNTATTTTVNCGRGRLTLFASPFGIEMKALDGPLRSENDRPLPKPCALRPEVRAALETAFQQQMLFDVDCRELSFITCRQGPGAYTLGVANNSWHELPLRIVSHCGLIESVRELSLDQSEKGAPGWLPERVTANSPGQSTADTIAGGDVRVFAIRLKEAGVAEIPQVAPPPRPHGRALPLPHPRSIEEAILAWPTFFEHFDGVVVDGRYLHEREPAVLRHEAAWLYRQGVTVFVDLSPEVDLYPGLRLINNLPADYDASRVVITNVMEKMSILGARDLILSLHRHPENNFTDEQARAGFETTLRALAQQAEARHLTVHLRMALGKPPWNLAEAGALLDRVGAANLRIAASTALLVRSGNSAETRRILKEKLGLWLVAGSRADVAGAIWDAHAPLHNAPDLGPIAACLALGPDRPLLLDTLCQDTDETYLDAVALARLQAQSNSKRQP
jgi:hypothetical protein